MSDQENEVRPKSPNSNINTVMEERMDSVREKYADPNLWCKLKLGESEVYWPQPRSVLQSMKELSTHLVEKLEDKFTELGEEKITLFLR